MHRSTETEAGDKSKKLLQIWTLKVWSYSLCSDLTHLYPHVQISVSGGIRQDPVFPVSPPMLPSTDSVDKVTSLAPGRTNFNSSLDHTSEVGLGVGGINLFQFANSFFLNHLEVNSTHLFHKCGLM